MTQRIRINVTCPKCEHEWEEDTETDLEPPW